MKKQNRNKKINWDKQLGILKKKLSKMTRTERERFDADQAVFCHNFNIK